MNNNQHEQQYEELKAVLSNHGFRIHSPGVNENKLIISSKLYLFDNTKVIYNDAKDLIIITCDLGFLRDTFDKVFEKKIDLCQITEEFLHINNKIDYKINFLFKKQASKKMLQLELTVEKEKFYNKTSFYLNSLTNNIREYIELIQYLTLPDDNTYFYIQHYSN